MKHIFLLNSFGLKKRTLEIHNKLDVIAKQLDLDYKIEVNSETQSTEDIVKKYSKGKNIIYAVGGDGQINRVLNAIQGTKNILGILPVGTGNDFYKTVKETLNNGENTIDLLKINNMYFINIACFGIDAVVGNNTEIIHSRIIPKKQRYNISLLYNFLTYKPRKMKVICDGEEYDKEFTTVVACNGRYYGGGYKVGTKSDLTDGKIELYLYEKMSKASMAKLILGMKSGKHEESPKLIKHKTKKLKIVCNKAIECNVDGEILKANKFTIELIHKGQTIFFNKEVINLLYENKNI